MYAAYMENKSSVQSNFVRGFIFECKMDNFIVSNVIVSNESNLLPF